MRMVDFEFNGERLSEYGFMPCFFNTSPQDSVEIGNNVTINKVKPANGDKFISTGYSYGDPFTVNFQTCKNVCGNIHPDISDVEVNYLVRWLNRKGYYKLRPIYEDGNFADVYYEGHFNVKLIMVGDRIVGLDLTFNSNAPYGFVGPLNYNYTFNSPEDKLSIFDWSDEVGYIYADATIELLEDGDLTIKNSIDVDNDIVVKNCKVGEKIVFYGVHKMITTTSVEHDVTLCNDFNYNFFRVRNHYGDTRNDFSANLKCKLAMSYSPIRKVGIVV